MGVSVQAALTPLLRLCHPGASSGFLLWVWAVEGNFAWPGEHRVMVSALRLSRRAALLTFGGAAAALSRAASAQRLTIRIGVLNDQSGPYKDLGGPVAMACVR